MRVGPASAVAAVAVALAAAPAAHGDVNARLAGKFAMKGTVTRAEHVRGEHRGQRVSRTWRFRPKCASGPCKKVVLTRGRGHGRVQTLTLKRQSAGHYYGKGRFYFRLFCAGVVQRRGAEARVSIHVHITKARVAGPQLMASQIRATYRNRRRINHTQCRGRLGRDGARYTGHLQSGR